MAATHFKLEDFEAWFSFGQTPSRIEVQHTLTGGLGRPSDNKIKFVANERIRSEAGNVYAKKYQEEEKAEMTTPQYGHGTTVELPGGEVVSLSQLDELEELTTVGTELPSVNELRNEQTSQIYSTYYANFNHKYNEDLTITSYKDEIIQNIQTRDVIIIQGNTGCGKTTQVPQYILDDCARRGVYCNIAVTQPRRIAAISIAQRVCQERGWRIGTIVGYQVGMDKVNVDDTRLCYMTTGVLLQKLVNAKTMNAFTHVIIDEVHERDQDTDLTMLVVKKFLRSNSRGVKVILMSATIDTDIYSHYYASVVRSNLSPAMIVSVLGKQIHVAEYYINELRTLGAIPDLNPDDPKIAREAYDLAHKLIVTFDKIEVVEADEETEERMAVTRGTVLMFLPGFEEITQMRKLLEPEITLKRWWILPLHSSITKDEQSRVFQQPQPGYRKIILSTNIAESSITVPDIKYVIDFCLTRSMVCDPMTNYSCLQLEWASKANCQQRKGRAGRVSEGRVYRMVSLRFYEDHLPEYATPEMKRCPLDQSILSVKKLEMGEPKALLALALQPPNLMDIEVAILNLKEVGALATTVNGQFYPYDGDLTFVGNVMSKLPLDIKISKLILLGVVFDCLEECLIIAASLSINSFFARPFLKFLEAYRSRLAWAEQSFSDCFAYLQAYQMWRVHREANLFSKSGYREDKWAQNNFIQLRKIIEVDLLVRELKQRLSNMGIKVPQAPQLHAEDMNTNMSLILKFVICGAFFPNYFVQEELDEKEVHRTLGNKNPLNSVVVSGLPSNQGILYEHRIRDIFKVCSSDMDIDYEEGKAYIQFGSQVPEQESDRGPDFGNKMPIPSVENKISTAVYVAIKMRQLRMEIPISVFTPAVAKRKMEHLEKLRNDYCDKNNALRSHRVKMLPDDRLHPTYQHMPQPGIDKLVFEMEVSEIKDCGHFFARYSNDESNMDSSYIEAAINMFPGKNHKPLSRPLAQNALILAPYTYQGETKYYRAIYAGRCSEKAPQVAGKPKVMVFFIDYGNSEAVAISDLREMDSEAMEDLYRTPAQAFKCALANIRAKINPHTSTRQYEDKANFFFKRLVTGVKLIARIYSVVQDVVRIELVRRLDDDREQSINQELIKMNFAESYEENYQSRQNHELRLKCSTLRSIDVASFNRAQQDDHCVAISMREMDPTGSTSVHKLNLRGPYSPLEVSYMGITRKASNRKVKIERDSVNSVTLDPEPQDKSSRMLVACNISIASDNSFISCRNTTIMPNIRGLPSLMTLIFAPSAEFRTDPERKRYTGALCGLGFIPKTKEPLYQEHDSELIFDTEYDIDDIFKINAVRICINVILGTEGTLLNIPFRELRDYQRRARRNITELMCKDRQPLTPTPFWNPYEWGQVHEEHILKSEMEGQDADCKHLLPLHAAIALTEDTWKDNLRNQVRNLHRHANSRLQISIVNKCPLCNVMTYTPKELLDHLSTAKHREKEEPLMHD